jgi:hypothetical protein
LLSLPLLRSTVGQHLSCTPVKQESGWTRDGVIGLRPDQLVPKLEPTLNLAKQTFVLQARERFAGCRLREVHNLIQRQVCEPAPQHRREVERGARRCIEAGDLTVEHGADSPGDPQIRGWASVERLEIRKQRGGPVRQPFARQQLKGQRVAVARLEDPADWHLGKASLGPGHDPADEALCRRGRKWLELQGAECPDRAVGDERSGRRGDPHFVGACREDHQ